MTNNGYTNVDFLEHDILEENLKIDGIFEKVKNAFDTGKLVMCINAKYDNMYSTPIPVFLTKASDTKYFASSSILQLVINSDDTIEVNNLTQGE